MADERTNSKTGPRGYLERTHRPLNCLVFVGPLLVAYEVGRLFLDDTLLAPRQLAELLGVFGASGRFVPALLIVVVLLAWHILSKQKWHIEADAVAGMAVESLLWWLPLLGASLLLERLFAAAAPPAVAALQSVAGGNGEATAATGRILRGIGSGIYEEFIFRLAGISVVLLVAVDILRLPRKYVAPPAIVALSVLFALYHFIGEPFAWQRMVFLLVAGLYLSVIYVARGFGVAVGAHACFNIAIALMHPAPG